MTLRPGQRVEWNHTPRGGYGYSEWIPGVIVSVGPKRVCVEVGLKAGGTKLVRVTAEKLREVR